MQEKNEVKRQVHTRGKSSENLNVALDANVFKQNSTGPNPQLSLIIMKKAEQHT